MMNSTSTTSLWRTKKSNYRAMQREIRFYKEMMWKLNPDFVRKSRTEFLEGEIERIDTDIERLKIAQRELSEEWFIDLLNERHEELTRKRRGCCCAINSYEKKQMDEGKLTEEEIETARNFPIESILELNEKQFACCPFHEDKRASAFCKNNFLHCFACNESADTIKIYQKIYGVDFRTAVKALNNHA